jgi:hypothetical protein
VPEGEAKGASTAQGSAGGIILAVSGAVALVVAIAVVLSGRAPAPISGNQSELVVPGAPMANVAVNAAQPAAMALASSITPLTSDGVRLSCSLSATESFNAPPGAATTAFRFDPDTACVNGRTPYERSASGYTRILRADATQTVSVLNLSGDLRRFERRDFNLAPEPYQAVAADAAPIGRATCAAGSQAALSRLRRSATPYLAGQPARTMTWYCVRGGG